MISVSQVKTLSLRVAVTHLSHAGMAQQSSYQLLCSSHTPRQLLGENGLLTVTGFLVLFIPAWPGLHVPELHSEKGPLVHLCGS